MANKIFSSVGKPEQRIDAVEKSTGKVRFVGDYTVPGLMHAKLVKSTQTHAKILSIDTTEAWKCPGVRAIIHGRNVSLSYRPDFGGQTAIGL